VRARCPASSANLGPGFDALAVALALYVDVTVEPADGLSIDATGEGADLPRDATHLAARVVRDVLGHDNVRITVHSEIPVGRGLGSSAALAVAAAAAAGADAPLEIGTLVDGHPENAAASVLGGLVAASMVDGHGVAYPLALDEALCFVVVVPDRELKTAEARTALPAMVPHADAAANLSRMGLLVAGLADAEMLRPAATDDRLHQLYRAALFPEANDLMLGLVRAGALASCWSGAGPSVLGICTDESAPAVRDAGEQLLADLAVPGRVLDLDADRVGLLVSDA